jgi:hypothetical protein
MTELGRVIVLGYSPRRSHGSGVATIWLKIVVDAEEVVPRLQTCLRWLIDSCQTCVWVDVMARNGRSLDEILQSSSRDVDLVFLDVITPGSAVATCDEQRG